MTATNPALVPIGIEFEFRHPCEEHDCNCDYCGHNDYDDEHGNSDAVIDGVGHPEGWEVGDDNEWVEIRSEPTNLEDADQLVRNLAEWITKYERYFGMPIEIQSDCSFHIHVNCVGFEENQQVDKERLLAAYAAKRDEYVSLLQSPYRENSHWCSGYSEIRDRTDEDWLGTIEFRMFDATKDLDLMLKRVALIREMVAKATQPFGLDMIRV